MSADGRMAAVDEYGWDLLEMAAFAGKVALAFELEKQGLTDSDDEALARAKWMRPRLLAAYDQDRLVASALTPSLEELADKFHEENPERSPAQALAVGYVMREDLMDEVQQAMAEGEQRGDDERRETA